MTTQPGMTEQIAEDLASIHLADKELDHVAKVKCIAHALKSYAEQVTESSRQEIDALRNEIQFLNGIIDSKDGQLSEGRTKTRELLSILENAIVLYKASNSPQEFWDGWIDKFNWKVSEVLSRHKTGAIE